MKITYEQIMSFKPRYNPVSIGMPETYNATIPEFIVEYRDKFYRKEDIFKEDVVWVLCRNEFMTDKELRWFAIWCTKQIQHLVEHKGLIYALVAAEKYVNDLVPLEHLQIMRESTGYPSDAPRNGWSLPKILTWAVTWEEAWLAARAAARDANNRGQSRNSQIDKLLAFFITKENNQEFDWS